MAADASSVTDVWRVRAIVSTMIPLLMVLSLLEMGGGLVLERFKDALLAYPTLLIVLPVMIGMGGNLGAILSSRIATGIHVGSIEPRITDATVLAHAAAVIGLASTLSVVLAVIASIIGSMLTVGALAFPTLLLITVASGVTLAVTVALVGVSVTFGSYRYGVDPDDTAIPIVTNVCDIMGVFILIGYTLLFL